MRALFVLVSAMVWAQSGSAPPKESVETLMAAFQTDSDDAPPAAAGVMRYNAEISIITEKEKPLQEQLAALEKSKEPLQKVMQEKIDALCRIAKVPEDAIKAKQCTPRLTRDKDGKEVIEILWSKPKTEPKAR